MSKLHDLTIEDCSAFLAAIEVAANPAAAVAGLPPGTVHAIQVFRERAGDALAVAHTLIDPYREDLQDP
jgi:hypothetical protein